MCWERGLHLLQGLTYRAVAFKASVSRLQMKATLNSHHSEKPQPPHIKETVKNSLQLKNPNRRNVLLALHAALPGPAPSAGCRWDDAAWCWGPMGCSLGLSLPPGLSCSLLGAGMHSAWHSKGKRAQPISVFHLVAKLEGGWEKNTLFDYNPCMCLGRENTV